MHAQRLLFGGFVLDAAHGTLLRDGVPVAIGHRAISLLAALAKADGRVLSKAELIDAAWPGAVVEESNLSVQVAALRKLLGSTPDGGEAIATIARVGYRFCLPVEIAQSPDGDDPHHAAVADARPSIAVLPLVNLGGDPDQEYFADGVTEEIIMALSRFRWFRVVGRGSSFAFKHRRVSTPEVAAKLAVRYVLEGSVRKFAGQVRIALQLIEAAGASELWGEHYDFAAADIFAMQDSIAQQVAGAVEPELLKTASAEAVATRPAADASLQDLVYRGVWLFHRVDRASHLEARELFRQACRRAPELGAAQFWLARVNAGVVAYGWSASEPADLREGIAAATQAIRADEKSPYAHYALAITSVFASEFEQAMRAAQRAIELAPGFALGNLVLGMARLYSGDAAGAIAPLSDGLQLNRFDPQNFVWYNTLAYAHLFTGDPAGALAASRKAQEIRPDWAPAVESALCAFRAQGDELAAGRCVIQLMALPAGSGKLLAPLRQSNPSWDAVLSSWLAPRAKNN
jgi:TolB-like protein/Flp pilus assembly protein TadD